MKVSTKRVQKKKQWCPMEGTNYEGFCVENFATIRVKGAKCSHHDYCEKLKKDLDKNENQTNS
jgi:hypothetical protein